MPNDVGVPKSYDFDLNSFVELKEYEAQPSRFGFNPRVRGYQKAAGQRRVLLMVLCSGLALISGSLWFCERLSAWQAVLGIVGPLLLVAAAEWSWRRSRFCRSCGVRTKSPRARSALVWCPVCHNLNDPARITVEPAGRFDITSIDYLAHVDPVVRFLDTVVLMGIKDHAREIRFEPDQRGYKIRCVIQEEIYEFAPSPSWLASPVAQIVKAIAGLELATRDQKQEGHIDVVSGGHHVPTDVIVEPTDFGQKVTLQFPTEY
jgi:hypothetical protein